MCLLGSIVDHRVPKSFGIMKIIFITLLMALGLGASACATTSSDGSQNKSGIITLEEIEGSGYTMIAITDEDNGELDGLCEYVIRIPPTEECFSPP